MSSKKDIFLHNKLYDFAKSLTAVESAAWEKVRLIFSYCPQPDADERFTIHPHSLDCIIALGTFYVQSGFLHTDKILPYLLNLLRGLKGAKWLQEDETSDIPYAESFSFCLNTLLSEISASHKEDIYAYQLNEIINVSSSVLSIIKNGFSDNDQQQYFFNILLPILFGLSQSMGRYRVTEGSFFCYLFPKYKSCIGVIYHLKKSYDVHNVNLFSSVCKQSGQLNPKICNHIFQRLYCSYEPLRLMNIFEIIQTLLSDETITLFNLKIVGLQRHTIYRKSFYYNICELLKSIFIMLFKDVFCYQKNLSNSFMHDLKNFVDEFYLSLQKNSFVFDQKANENDLEELTFQNFKINVLTNVISLELLSWAVCETSDAQDLCVRVTKLLNRPYPEKMLIINAPLIIACCETLGNLAQRFPGVASGCVNILRDFLSLPSPSLAKLCHHTFLSCGDDSFPGNTISPLKAVWFEHSIFKKVQYSAIENICLSLKVTFDTDNNDYIAAFLTSFSCLLYMEKSHPHYALVTENVVVTLGHLLFSVSTFSKSILQCFQQRLRRHSVESDVAIIHQLGNLIILNENEEIILETLKIFSNMILEVNNDINDELRHISNILYIILNNVAEKLHNESKICSIFIRFLEIFVQCGLDEYQCLDDSTVPKNPAVKSNQDKILQIISLLAKKLPNQLKLKKQQERLFQDFWLYFILSKDLAIFYCDNPCLKAIAPKFPSLNSDSLTDHDLREFFYTSSFNKAKISPEKQNSMKTQLLGLFQNSPDIVGVVNKLTFSQLIYAHSVCSLEIIRIQNSEETSIEPLFSYLINQKLQKDKYGMWQCICKIADKIFEAFLSVMSNKERNDAREVVLEKHAQFLLIHFNNINPQVRHIADKFLSELIGRFPHLLWNRQVLWSLLDILTVLLYSLQISPSDQIMTLDVPNSVYNIHLMDTKKLREEIFNDFVARSQEIISEARKWASPIINSHLQEYILQERSIFSKDNSVSNLQNHTWTLLCSNQAYSVFELGDILSSLSSRSQYMGEISGLLEKSKITPAEFSKNLSEAVWKACEEEDIVKYESAMKRAAAFAVCHESMTNEIKQVLATSHIKFFTPEVMMVIVQCWNWLCTVLPKFEFDLLKEMFLAWQFTVDKKIGLFSAVNVMNFYNSTNSELKSEVRKQSDSHEIWVKFISQVIESTKYCSQEKLELLICFFHKTLPMTIGGTDSCMKRDSEYLVARFTLLSSALSLLQSDVSLTPFNRIIVRQRIYCTCLDYFCSLKEFPSKTGLNLKSCIEVLIKFWHVMFSDKKYISKIPSKNTAEEIVEAKQHPIYDVSSDLSNRLFYLNSSQLKHVKFNELGGGDLECSFFPDFKKKRKLSLCLLAEEIQFLSAWYNPCDHNDLAVSGEDLIKAWQTKFFSLERSVKDIAKTAWEISPVLAVHLPQRMNHDSAITSEISKLILLNPTSVSHVPHAVELLVTVENIQKESRALTHLLSWAEASPLQALALFSQNYPPHPIVLAYASKTLLNCDSGILVLYIPQLVQCLRHDPLGYVAEVIKAAAHKSPLFCHQIIWNMKANMYTDINMTQKSLLYDKLNDLVTVITESFGDTEKIFYLREFKFIDQITEVSKQIPRNLKHEERKRACLNALNNIKMKPGCYLPSNPRALLFNIDYNSGTPLQSKTRTPYLAKFQMALCSIDKVNEIGLKVSEQEKAGFPVDENDVLDDELGTLVWQPTIFKAGDDVRQDILALQVIKLLEQVYDRIGLDVFLFPYNVIAIAPGMGIIECVPNASSRDELGKQTNVGLYDYFITTFGDEKSTRFRNAQRNFIKSVAGYSVVNFLLQIKDRHNGNILIDEEGHIIHIDFGFMFESSPGGNLGFEPDMKLTEEMVMIMGGKMESEPFRWFTELCVKAFLAARSYQEEIITLVTLMLDSGLPCFRGQTIKLLRARFAPNTTDREAADYIITVIRNSFLNFRTVTYDMLQYLQNSIQY